MNGDFKASGAAGCYVMTLIFLFGAGIGAVVVWALTS